MKDENLILLISNSLIINPSTFIDVKYVDGLKILFCYLR